MFKVGDKVLNHDSNSGAYQEEGVIKEIKDGGIGIKWDKYGYHFYTHPSPVINRMEVLETTMIKIKAGVNKEVVIDRPCYGWSHEKDYKKTDDYSVLKIRVDGAELDIKIGDPYRTIEEVNKFIKPLGFEIIETESIDTFERLDTFCGDNKLYRKVDSFILIGGNDKIETLNIEEVENKFDVSLDVLKGE